jgi:anionic cell wall polymer biosynthesis LytR-Cps2A-Psr (LCP) family protein
MKLARILVVLAALLSLQAVVAGAAPASTVDECQSKLETLRAETVAVQSSFTTTKEFDGAVFKLDDAAAKLAAGKNADAVAKLTGFQTTVNALATAPKPKLAPATAQSLSTGAQGVIDCINAIGTA